MIFEHAAVACGGSIYDPAQENDLTENWSFAQRAGIVRAFLRLAESARRALAFEADGDPDAALDLWHSIFGDQFPAPDPRSPKDVMSAWAVGSLSPTGRPSTSTAGNYQVSPGRGWLAY